MVDPQGPVLTCAGRQFHVRHHDGMEPAVLLMSGCGLAMEYWSGVNARLSERRVIAYDRPGMGGTTWPGHLPTLHDEVESLASLLDQVNVQRVVLVAHSMASFHAEALARKYPEKIAGIVFVDGSVEWYTSRPKPSMTSLPRKLRMALRTPTMGDVGGMFWRFGTYMQSNWDYSRLGYGRLPAIYRDPDSLVMATAESIAYARQGWDLLKYRPKYPFPKVPVVVLTAGSNEDWINSTARYAQLLGGRQVVVEESRHLMMLDCPDVIEDAVRSILTTDAAAHAVS